MKRSQLHASLVRLVTRILDDKGQALLEFALVTPMLIMLLVGIISFGLYINANVSLEQAVRVGARAASIGDPVGNTTPTPQDSVKSFVMIQLNQSPGLDPSTAHLSVSCSSDGGTTFTSAGSNGSCPSGANNLVQVSVSDVYNPILPIPGLLPSSITIHQTYTLMME